MIIPNLWKNKKCSKPPTSITSCSMSSTFKHLQYLRGSGELPQNYSTSSSDGPSPKSWLYHIYIIILYIGYIYIYIHIHIWMYIRLYNVIYSYLCGLYLDYKPGILSRMHILSASWRPSPQVHPFPRAKAWFLQWVFSPEQNSMTIQRYAEVFLQACYSIMKNNIILYHPKKERITSFYHHFTMKKSVYR